MIWDFRGSVSVQTAKHHCIHLKEYATIEKLNFYEINSIEISDMHSIAFITVDEIDMKIFRDALKPHRGELA
mgnify:FL=1